MCGLYSLRKSPRETRAWFRYAEEEDFPPRAHVAPGQPIAIVRVENGQRRFALVANRFAWDQLPAKERRRTGLTFNGVTRVRRQGPQEPDALTILSLLAITFTPTAGTEELGGAITLTFSGGHVIALDVEVVDVALDDLGPAWSTDATPEHGS